MPKKRIPVEGLYIDPDTGKVINTHSMLKTFRRCPKQTEYKYIERLQPKVMGRPLRLGTWMHSLQEVQGKGGDWKEEHERLTKKWDLLFDEEKDAVGNLPQDCYNLFKSYLWYYKADEWKYLDTEFTLECEFPDGSLFRCKVDNLIENQYGLWIVDHKWHKTLPNHDYRILDAQSADYVWCALQNGIPVQGHIWNYGRSKVPTYPEELKAGGPARWESCDTDYPTMVRWFKEHPDVDANRYAAKLRYLKSQRYLPGQAQTSNFFRRVVLEKSPAMLKRVAQEAYHTSKRMNAYPFNRPDIVERVPDRSCTFMCNYTDLCSAELTTGQRPINWQKRYKVGDPMYYYQDDREEKDPNAS